MSPRLLSALAHRAAHHRRRDPRLTQAEALELAAVRAQDGRDRPLEALRDELELERIEGGTP